MKNRILIVLGGLPGTGKTTIGRQLVALQSSVYLRIDAIEHALQTAYGKQHEVGPAGYMTAYALAGANLALGMSVVADCVNPLAVTREAWRKVAADTSSFVLEVEVICSDAVEHRRRVEGREPDMENFVLPTWHSVKSRHYEPWTTDRFVIDSADLDPREAAQMILEQSRRVREVV